MKIDDKQNPEKPPTLAELLFEQERLRIKAQRAHVFATSMLLFAFVIHLFIFHL